MRRRGEDFAPTHTNKAWAAQALRDTGAMNLGVGGIALQDGQMPQGKGTGHGSEGGTKPSKAAGKGRSTQYKGSLAEP